MRREDIIDVVGRLQPTDLTKLVFVLTGGCGIITDLIFRTDPDFIVVRGRETGTNDESRAFFVPYAEVSYLRLERVVKVNDLKRMYGLPVTEADADEADAATAVEATAAAAVAGAAKTAPQDPAAIAKQNLLDRIRAARTSAGSSKPTATK